MKKYEYELVVFNEPNTANFRRQINRLGKLGYRVTATISPDDMNFPTVIMEREVETIIVPDDLT